VDRDNKRRQRRGVMNEVRRKIERDARVAAMADELAEAVERLLADPEHANLESLGMALARYRQAAES